MFVHSVSFHESWNSSWSFGWQVCLLLHMDNVYIKTDLPEILAIYSHILYSSYRFDIAITYIFMYLYIHVENPYNMCPHKRRSKFNRLTTMNYEFSFCVHSIFCTFVIRWPMVTHGADPSRLRHENHRKTRWCHKLLSAVDVTTSLFSWWVIFLGFTENWWDSAMFNLPKTKPTKKRPLAKIIYQLFGQRIGACSSMCHAAALYQGWTMM